MGFNTTVFILNDQFDALQKDPEEFVRAIAHNMNGGNNGQYGERFLIGQTTVMPTAHADTFRLYATHQNMILELSPYAQETKAMLDNDRHLDIVERMIVQAERELKGLKAMAKESRAAMYEEAGT